MTHELVHPAVDPTTRLVRYACTCKSWHRTYHENMVAPYSEIESAHETHRQHAGAEELRAGHQLASTTTLEGVIREMTKIAASSVAAMEQMDEFVQAYQQAQLAGSGVVVVRKANGSLTSTPNVFVPAGSAIFIDEPGLPAFQTELELDLGVNLDRVGYYRPSHITDHAA